MKDELSDTELDRVVGGLAKDHAVPQQWKPAERPRMFAAASAPKVSAPAACAGGKCSA